MKKTGTYFIILCIMISLTIFTFMILGYLSSPTSIMVSWLGGLIIVGIFCILAITNFSNKIERLLPIYQRVYPHLRNVTESPINQVIRPECLKEIEKIRSRPTDEEISQVLCQPHFRRILSFWDRTDIIATFHALESLRDLSSNWLDKEFSTPVLNKFFDTAAIKIKNLLIERFNDEQGCWYANEENKNPSLDSAYAAFKIAQALLTLKGEKCTLDNLNSILGEERIEKFQGYLKESMDEDTGGFRDTDEEKATVGSTGLVIRISSILYNEGNTNGRSSLEEKMNRIFDFKADVTPLTFIMKCLKKIDVNGKQAVGFSGSIDNKEPWMCISYFAASSLKILGQTKSLKNKETSKMIASFLESCLRTRKTSENNQTTKGFAATPKYDKEDLMHTFYALKLAEILCPEYLWEQEKGFFTELSRFQDTCKSGYGYGFRKNWAPNVYATCLARHTNAIIKRFNKKQDTSFNPIDSLKFYTSCFNRLEFAFTGYPFETHF